MCLIDSVAQYAMRLILSFQRLQTYINNENDIKINVPCMVSRPSNCHVVTLGTLWNMQDTVHIGHNNKPGTEVFL